MSNLALQVSNISKTYEKSKAVDQVSFEIFPGEIFGLLGPNGAGKSSLINMISGVTRISSGLIKVFGYDNQISFRDTRRLVGVMHQEIVIDNFFTVGQTLEMYPGYFGLKDDPSWRKLVQTKLGLDAYLDKKMLKLSGGLKRRFMIAKALIHKPKLLILDEPTAGVDVELRRSLWAFVREMKNQGLTILLTTHYLEEAEQMCDRVAIMNGGKIIELDHTQNLIKRLLKQQIRFKFLESIPSQSKLLQYISVAPKDPEEIILNVSKDSDVADFFEIIRHENLRVVSFDLEKPTLEEVFLRITRT